jgi:toxin ParE1/3/4
MPQVLKRPQAEADLNDIWWHIAQDNPDAADRLLDSIDERCTTLAQFPYIGTSRDELMPALRSLPVGNYLIFYETVASLPGHVYPARASCNVWRVW